MKMTWQAVMSGDGWLEENVESEPADCFPGLLTVRNIYSDPFSWSLHYICIHYVRHSNTHSNVHVGVVNDAGILIGSLSASDFQFAAPKDFLSFLHSSVGEFLANLPQQNVACVAANATLGLLVKTLSAIFCGDLRGVLRENRYYW